MWTKDLGECQSSPSAHIAFYPRTAWPENDDADFEDHDDGDSDYDGGDYDKDNNYVDDDG